MAQIVLSEVGSHLGGSIGGLIGGQLGRALDQTALNGLLPARSSGPRLKGLMLNQASQGDPIKRVFGRARVNATIIWAARLKENRSETRANKSAGRTQSYSYSLSFACGLCEGEIDAIGRIWADGQLLDQSPISMRLYKGSEDQSPDSLIEAIEGKACAFRGTAYIVFEDLNISPFGNRIPNLSVEVLRKPRGPFADVESSIRSVNLIPGAGEFVYATSPIAVVDSLSKAHYENLNSGTGHSDFVASLDHLLAVAPNLKHVNLVIAWFGDDLRLSHCTIRPGVETRHKITRPYEWRVNGIGRDQAHLISQSDGRPNFGGTPCDASVIEALKAFKTRGIDVTMVPFLMMDIAQGNLKPDPYGAAEQAAFPWRGRITSRVAPERDLDQTQNVDLSAQVAYFMGSTQAHDYHVTDQSVTYSGHDDQGYRRFVLHLAALGRSVGGVESILIGSELRGLTRLRDATGAYPFVLALMELAQDVRALSSQGTKISYAADWSEYGAFAPYGAPGALEFPLDPLWASDDIDYIGLDWYPPLTDWRDGGDHLDAAFGGNDGRDPSYLASRIMGGEAYDWYYADNTDRNAQIRTPIKDIAYGRDFIFRQKDIKNWWSNPHYNRHNGVLSALPTAWQARSKPIRFVELGCAAINKGGNAPNLFQDPKSSESALPPFSNGLRDDAVQSACLQAYYEHFAQIEHNPISEIYGAPMLESMSLWAWDARPYPAFPARSDLWGDFANWPTGHWLNGRLGAGRLKNIVYELATACGLRDQDIKLDEVTGQIDSYCIEYAMSGRDALAPILNYLGLTLCESEGSLAIKSDHAGALIDLKSECLRLQTTEETHRLRDLINVPSRMNLRALDIGRDYQIQQISLINDQALSSGQVQIDLALGLTTQQLNEFGHYWLSRMNAVRESLMVNLDPLNGLGLEIGDHIRLDDQAIPYRVLAIDTQEASVMTLEPIQGARQIVPSEPKHAHNQTLSSPIMTYFNIVEVPLFGADKTDYRPILIAKSDPDGPIEFYAGPDESSLSLRGHSDAMVGIGKSLSPLPPQRSQVYLEHAFIDVIIEGQDLMSQSAAALRQGQNVLLIETQNGEFEWIQFRNAVLMGQYQYRLIGLIRGLWGTKSASEASIAQGAKLYGLGSMVTRATLAPNEFKQQRLWRAGPLGFAAAKSKAMDISFTQTGLGLRPLAPVHGRIHKLPSALIQLSWKRCARFDDENWDVDLALDETQEAYRLVFWDGMHQIRSQEVEQSVYDYTALQQAIDYPQGFGQQSHVTIVQISALYGDGLSLKLRLEA